MCNYKDRYGCNKEGRARMKQLENELTAMTKDKEVAEFNFELMDKKCKSLSKLVAEYEKQSDSFDAIPDEPIGYTVTTMVTHG